MKNIKVGIDAFNDLARSHDAHVKEVERLQKELDELNKLKLVDQKGELLLECRIGDKNHQLLLEVGLNTILERFVKKEKLSLYSKDEIKKYGEKKYQEYKDSLSKDDKEYLENKYGKMK
jgi:hypothetical protein